MVQSPEYPDLKWMPPKSWTDANRSSVQLIVIHDTEGSAHAQSAEDGAAYDQRRTDETSTHYFVDNDSVVQCVRTADQAHAARTQGNRRGIQYELCAKATFSRAKWLGADYGRPMLQRAARQAARDCRKWNIPAVKVSAAQVAAGKKGICGHADITYAFPADHGTHTDPGANFPWADFIDMIKAELEDDMTEAQAQQLKDIHWALFTSDSAARPPGTISGRLSGLVGTVSTLSSSVAALAAGDAQRAQQILAAIDKVDEQTVAALSETSADDAARTIIAAIGPDRAEALLVALGVALEPAV